MAGIAHVLAVVLRRDARGVAADVARRDACGAREGDENVRIVAAHPAALHEAVQRGGVGAAGAGRVLRVAQQVAAGGGARRNTARLALLIRTDDARIDAALLLGRTGARDQAKRLLAGERPEYARLQKQFGKKGQADAAFGAARMFLELAVEIAGEDMQPLTVLLTRSALLLDPRDDRARLFLAEALSQGGSHDLALSVLAEVRSDSPFARGASAGRIAALRRAGRTPEALLLAQMLATDSGATSADSETWGDMLVDQGHFDLAAKAYAAAIARPIASRRSSRTRS